MKRIFGLLLIILLTGCSKSKTLECSLNGASFEKGIMSVKIIFDLDEEENAIRSNKSQHIYFDLEKDALSFYEEYKDNTTVVNDLEIIYKETVAIDEAVAASYLKDQLELEEYSCKYKK